MSFDISKYREMFLEEAEELFESADNVLLEAENNGTLTDEEMGQLFRDVHTLKGSGASVELTMFAEFTHDVENMMDKLRNHEIEFIPEMAGTLIDGLDVMKEILDLEVAEELTRETFTEMTVSLLEEIRAYSSGNAPVTQEVTPVAQEKTSSEPKSVEHIEIDNDAIGFFDDDLNEQKDCEASYGFFSDDLEEAPKNYGFFDEELESIASIIDDSIPEVSEEKEDFGFFDDVPTISPDSVMETNEIKQEEQVVAQPQKTEPTVEVPAAKENNITASENMANELAEVATNAAAARPTRKPREGREEKTTAKKSSANNNIRVNLDKIDLLMNNVGDLVITNAMLTQFSTSIEEAKTRNAVLDIRTT
jgi:two-component system chemotaxis sensor kinase CheA